jgi:putative ABC transport system substrate-binding protein
LCQVADDPELDLAFEQGLAQRGWIGGRNVQIDRRHAIDSIDKTKATIAELLARPPDVIVAFTSRTVAALQKAMPTVPIVFATISEPVAQGLVQSLAHPSGNATGFTMLPATIGGKWLELLSEMAPAVIRVAYLCDPSNSGVLQPFAAVDAAARNHAIAVVLAGVHGATDIETVMTTLAREPGGGLIVPPDGFLAKYSKLIIELAAREKLPAIYGFASFAAGAAWLHMGSLCRSKSARLGSTSVAFCVERNPRTCRCSSRPNTNWSLISKPPRRSASTFRPPCSPAPIR